MGKLRFNVIPPNSPLFEELDQPGKRQVHVKSGDNNDEEDLETRNGAERRGFRGMAAMPRFPI